MPEEPAPTGDFTCICQGCGQSVSFINGERVPGPCPHELPSIVIDMRTEEDLG